MANGYPYGTVEDTEAGYPRTTAKVEFFNRSTGALLRTCYLSKAQGAQYWSYSTAIASGTYRVVGTNVDKGTSEAKDPVSVPAGVSTNINFVPRGSADAARASGERASSADGDVDKILKPAHKALRDLVSNNSSYKWKKVKGIQVTFVGSDDVDTEDKIQIVGEAGLDL